MLLGALSAAAAQLAACSAGPGPLGTGGDGGLQCSAGAQGRPITMGIYTLDNSGTAPVTVTSVTLPAALGLAMTKSWLVPIYHDPRNGNYVAIGVAADYPPIAKADTAINPEWRNRVPAAGATIRPGQTLNLVFGLIRTTAKAGRSDGPLISYTADRNSYTVQEQTGQEIRPGTCNSTP